MKLLHYIIYFIQNDMLITLFFMGGGMLITGWHPGKPTRYVRMALCFLMGMAWMMLTRLPYISEFQKSAITGIFRYMGLYLLCVMAVIFSCDVSAYSALYAVSIS